MFELTTDLVELPIVFEERALEGVDRVLEPVPDTVELPLPEPVDEMAEEPD